MGGSVVLKSIGMKSSCIGASLLLSTASAATPGPNYDLMWDHFKTKYGKVHGGITDESTRFQIFKGHVDFIHTTNAQNLTYRLKVNEFADLTTSEFVSQYTGYKPQNVWGGLDHEGSGDASEEPGTVWLVLGFFDHGFSRRCFVHRHGRFVAFERAAARGL